MAANGNYYGYSTGVQGSQVYGSAIQNQQMTQSAYSAQSAAAYGTGSTTPAANYGTATQRSVMPAQSAYTPTAASSYQTGALTGSSYGYTARVQDTTAQSYQTNAQAAYTSPSSYYARDNSQASSGGYDASKASSYYTQHAGTSQAYGYGSTASKSMYSAYSAPANTGNQMASPSGAKTNTQTSAQPAASNVSYPYKGQNTNYGQAQSSYSSPSNWSGSGGNYQHTQGYDAAVYNAASSYFQQQQQPRQQKWGNKNNQGNNQAGKSSQQRQRNPPRQQQVHYCEVCKISCAGPQTYKEHLEGQRHKKKEAAAKQMEDAGPDGYRCNLCDITCTGRDAFNAHLKGAKHMKTVKLHEKLGKPIPEVLSAADQDKDKKIVPKTQAAKPAYRNNQRRNRKPSAPKITFIGGQTLNTQTGETSKTSETAETAGEEATTAAAAEDGEQKTETSASEEGKESKFVGEDYVEEVKSDAGKVIGFECKLCECKFNDTLAREAHLKGRRHQLAYKKKVEPSYVVDQKPANRRQPMQPRSLMDDKARRRWEQDMYWRQQEAAWRNEEVRSGGHYRWGEEEYWRRLEEEERMWEEQETHRHDMNWGHRMGPHQRPDFLPHDMFPPNLPRPRQDSQDDRLVMAKHKLIYPNEQELSAVQNIVSAVEKALKLVSDCIAEEEAPVKTESKEEKMEVTEPPAEEKATEGGEEQTEGEEEKKTESEEAKKPEAVKPKEKIEQAPRTLKGVMRVGVLAKGLLLHERLDVQLVVLCQDRPTTQLLERVSSKLPEQLTKVADEKYDVTVDDCLITVSSSKEPAIKVFITLTSPVMRDEADAAAEEQKDVLDRDKCLEALASLRHAKWFQAKANGVPSCVVIIRLMRDMRDRLPVFTPLSSWALELLVEKCLSSAEQPLGPGEAFRRVLECIASGILLPGGPGLHDPCEKEVTDASKEMTAQEREELTAAAQHYLRLQAFRQLHKVLGVDPLPASKFRGGRYGRGGRFKRRREDSGQGDGSAKKEKKDGEDEEGKENKETPEANGDVAETTQAPVDEKKEEPTVEAS